MQIAIAIALILFVGLFVVMSVPLEADGSAPDDQPEAE